MRHLRRLEAQTVASPNDDRQYYRVDPYDIISILLETLSFGIFLVLFLLSTVLIVRRMRMLQHARAMEPVKLRSLLFYLVTGVLMFLTITAKWTFWWAEVLPIPGQGRQGIVVAQLPKLSQIAHRFEQVLLKFSVLLGDMVTIYRLWVLSNGNKIMVAFPTLGFFGFLACAIALAGPGNEMDETLIPIKNGKLQTSAWDTAATACTVSITVSVTLMIVGIVIRARSRAGAKVLGNGLNRALVVIVESAAIYTMWNIFFLISSLGFESEIALACLDSMPSIYGICVMLINVRVGLGWALSINERLRAPNHISTRGSCLDSHSASSSFSGGIYISTMVFTEPPGLESSYIQPSGDIEVGDARNAISPSGKLSTHESTT